MSNQLKRNKSKGKAMMNLKTLSVGNIPRVRKFTNSLFPSFERKKSGY